MFACWDKIVTFQTLIAESCLLSHQHWMGERAGGLDLIADIDFWLFHWRWGHWTTLNFAANDWNALDFTLRETSSLSIFNPFEPEPAVTGRPEIAQFSWTGCNRPLGPASTFRTLTSPQRPIVSFLCFDVVAMEITNQNRPSAHNIC